ncbi:Ca2+-binding RTX toxin-like protein [Caulobacter ginsengisoli]|uniref:Ca2+-binding RTX toxin-like protein n=1 Tax=Caulobacter ginsengisoli TaxID=400775 RepID=A0ABU0IN95_9CAUL|nr:hypothetical protein [Caulobacter ginsengisoli]MDQ0463476.1 Ca2+-binding RTX toxin-like protein [Caulobacter ginsengisoli]
MADFPAEITFADGDGVSGFLIDGAAAGDTFGYSVTAAGDLNGDGIDDFVIGAPTADVPDGSPGAAYVVFGTAGGFPASFSVSSLDGTNGFKISGEIPGDDLAATFGHGDFNGDGIDDLAIGAIGADPHGSFSGAVYIVFGKDTAQAGDFSANLDLSTLTGPNGFQINGVSTNDQAGRWLSSAGDINGDGVDDVLIGTNKTTAYVVFGRDTGVSGDFAASLDLSSLNGTNGFQITNATAASSASAVSRAGDVNGDGIDDLIVGDASADVNGTNSGAAYVLYGKDTSVSGAFAASIAASSITGSTGFTIRGPAASAAAGFAVGAAGDVNGDGIDDVIVSALDASQAGKVYVVFGQSGGFASGFDLSTIDGTNGFRIDGQLNRGLGRFAQGAGDINGDGVDDIVISERALSSNNAGYVVFGRNTAAEGDFAAAISITDLDGSNGFRVEAVSASGFFGSQIIGGGGDFNDDGIDDLLFGGMHDGANGQALIYYGHVAGQTWSGTIGIDAHDGGASADTLNGLAGDDTLNGLGGADHLNGADGADFLYGGTGVDTLDGGNNGDWLDGGTGADAMTGGAGDDSYIVDDFGDTTVEVGGEGSDVVYATVTWMLGSNIEKLILDGSGDIDGTGNSAANTIIGNSGVNTISGGDGDDLIKAGGGADTVLGDLGNDQLLGQDGDDRLSGGDGADRLDGGNGEDSLTGGIGNDVLDGGAGIDSLNGGTGADQLNGGSENDTLIGDDGNDVLNGGLGADTMVGGLGDDSFYVDDAGDLIGEVVGQGTDTVRATATFTLAANVENLIQDGSGNIDATGNSLANALTGNGGANSLDGGAGDDVIKAGLGADTLIGGTGNDILVGGGGLDTFVVTQASIRTSGAIEVDTVNDLIAGQGDRLDLSAIDADISTGGDDAFHLVGGFTHHAGEMTLSFAAGVTTLQLDVNGDGRADYRMTIAGNVTGDSGGWLL